MEPDENWAAAIGAPHAAWIAARVRSMDAPYNRENTFPGMAADELGIEPAELTDALWTEALEALDHRDPDNRRERAEEAICECPLSILYRSGWTVPHNRPEPEEAEVLLCTGGPAVRLRVELPSGRTTMEVQDWGKPWTEYLPAYPACVEFRRTLDRFAEILAVAELAPAWELR